MNEYVESVGLDKKLNIELIQAVNDAVFKGEKRVYIFDALRQSGKSFAIVDVCKKLYPHFNRFTTGKFYPEAPFVIYVPVQRMVRVYDKWSVPNVFSCYYKWSVPNVFSWNAVPLSMMTYEVRSNLKVVFFDDIALEDLFFDYSKFVRLIQDVPKVIILRTSHLAANVQTEIKIAGCDSKCDLSNFTVFSSP